MLVNPFFYQTWLNKVSQPDAIRIGFLVVPISSRLRCAIQLTPFKCEENR